MKKLMLLVFVLLSSPCYTLGTFLAVPEIDIDLITSNSTDSNKEVFHSNLRHPFIGFEFDFLNFNPEQNLLGNQAQSASPTIGLLCSRGMFDEILLQTLGLKNGNNFYEHIINSNVEDAIKVNEEIIKSNLSSYSQFEVGLGIVNNIENNREVRICPDAGTNGSLIICELETPNDSELFGALNGNPDIGGVWTSGSLETISFLGYNEDPLDCLPSITTVTASTATVNDEITIVFQDLNNDLDFTTLGYSQIYMYGGLQTDGFNDFQGAPASFNDLGSQPLLNSIGPVNVVAGTNNYSITINLAQFYTDVADGANVTGFNIVFQNGTGGDLINPTIHQSCELFIDLVDAIKNSNASRHLYTYTIAAEGECPEVSANVTVTETLAACAPILKWSIGQVQVTYDGSIATEICYPLMVSINNTNNTPQLATTSMRFFYDSNLLNNLSVGNIQNGYTILAGGSSGFGDPPGTGPYGTIFGFSSSSGNWVNFDIVPNNGNPLGLSSASTHVLDFCFTPNSGVTIPICAPIVFDNNHKGPGAASPAIGWGLGINGDDGYLTDDEGITGSLYINGIIGNAILADDEVINYKWLENNNFDGIVDDPSDRAGNSNYSCCIENTCDDCPAAVANEALIIYVDGNSTGANTGLTWEDAYVNLSEAILLSNDCPQINEIWVKEGTHMPSLISNRSQSFFIKNKLKIIGGFPASISSPLMIDRNTNSFPTILSGNIGSPIKGDNSYHIIQNIANDTLFLIGITIEYAYGDGIDLENQEGAGISNLGALILDQVTIQNCEAIAKGSAIHALTGSYLEMKDCQLSVNGGPYEIYIENGSIVKINGVVVVNE